MRAENETLNATLRFTPCAVDGCEAFGVEITNEVVSYIASYGGRCRDCGDEDGICPTSGLPCDCRYVKTIRHVLGALNYGIANGYISLRSPYDAGETDKSETRT